MKKIKLLLSLILVCILTGCVKYNAVMEVKDDKSLTFEVVYGIDLSVTDGIAGTESEDDSDFEVETEVETGTETESVTTESYAYLEEYGYKVEKFEEKNDSSNIEGVKITKIFSNIDDISDSKKITVDMLSIFSEENIDKVKDLKLFYKDGGKYEANFTFNFLGEGEERNETYDQFITDLNYTIKLPVAPENHNASKVSEDGKELTWNFTYSKINEVNFSFTLEDEVKGTEDSKSFNIAYIFAAVAIVVALIVILLLVTKKKKLNRDKKMANNVQPMNQNNNSVQQGSVNSNQQTMVNQQPGVIQQPEVTNNPVEEIKTENND